MRLYLRHDACRHDWAAARLPMAREALADLLAGARCPICGGGGGIKAVEAREPTIAEGMRP